MKIMSFVTLISKGNNKKDSSSFLQLDEAAMICQSLETDTVGLDAMVEGAVLEPTRIENNTKVYDVEIASYGNYKGHGLPLAFLISKSTGKPIKGYPVAVEVSKDSYPAPSTNVHGPAISHLDCLVESRSFLPQLDNSSLPQLDEGSMKCQALETDVVGLDAMVEDAVFDATGLENNTKVFDVEIAAYGNHNGCGLPLAFLISKSTGKPIKGYPVAVEVLEDSCPAPSTKVHSPVISRSDCLMESRISLPQLDEGAMKCQALETDVVGLDAMVEGAIFEVTGLENNTKVYDVEIGYYGNYKGHGLPLDFLISKSTGKHIKGYPVAGEVLEDSCPAPSSNGHSPAISSLDCLVETRISLPHLDEGAMECQALETDAVGLVAMAEAAVLETTELENNTKAYDVEIASYGNYKGHGLPLAVLISTATGKPIKGYPVTVEVLEDSCPAPSRNVLIPAISHFDCIMEGIISSPQLHEGSMRCHALETDAVGLDAMVEGAICLWKLQGSCLAPCFPHK